MKKLLSLGLGVFGITSLVAQQNCQNDQQAPMVQTKNIQVQLDQQGLASITAAMVDDGSFDNCSIDTLFLDKYSFGCADVGMNTVTLTARDAGGAGGSGGVDTVLYSRLNGSQRTVMNSGDVNGDGREDVLIANTLYLQIQPLVFRPFALGAGGGQNGGVMGDVDGDGDDEIINGKYLYDWDLNTNRLAVKQSFTTQPVFFEPLLVDLTGDGHLDYYRPTYYGQDEELWENDGQGNFTLKWSKRVGAYQISAGSGDVDGDGDVDMLVGGYYDLYLATNDGTGNFTYRSVYTNGNAYINEVEIADMDGDGIMDLLASDCCTGVFWFKGDGQGNYGSRQIVATPDSGRYGLTEFADVNQDGSIDIVHAISRKPVRLLTNDGQGNFSSEVIEANTAGYNYQDALVADLNGDGILDIAGSMWGPSFIATRLASASTPNEASATAQVEVLPAQLNVTASFSGQLTGAGVDGQSIYLGYGPQSVMLNAQSNYNGTLNYQWAPATSLNNATSASPLASPQQTTTYTVTATDAQGCYQGTATVTVNVIDVRCGKRGNKVAMCHNGKTICVSKNAVASHLAHANHKKWTCSLGPCGAAAKNEGALAASFDYHLFPNPTQGAFTLQIHSEKATDARFVITDLQGRVIAVKEETTAEGTTEYRFDISQYAAGVYMLNVITPEQRFSERIVKQ